MKIFFDCRRHVDSLKRSEHGKVVGIIYLVAFFCATPLPSMADYLDTIVEHGKQMDDINNFLKNRNAPNNPPDTPPLQADPSDPNVQLMLGERARAMKDEIRATQLFSLAAASGHPKAQLFLGFRYLYGIGAPKNPEAAAFWLRKAAAQGEAVAQEELMRQVTNKGEQSIQDTIDMINKPIK